MAADETMRQLDRSTISILSQKEKRNDWALQRLIDLIAEGGTLEQMAALISEAYAGRPIVICDNAFSILAHSDEAQFHRFDTDDLVKDLQNGFIDMRIIDRVRAEQSRALFNKRTTKPAVIRHFDGKFKQYCTPVLIGAVTSGYFNVFLHADEELDAADVLLLERIAKLISIALQRADYYSANKAHLYSLFFASVLHDPNCDVASWQRRLEDYGCRLLPRLRIVMVQPQELQIARNDLASLASSIRNALPGSIYYIENGSLIFLCSYADGDAPFEKLVQHSEVLIASRPMKIGISAEAAGLDEVRRAYDEAAAAIRVGTHYAPEDTFYFFDALRMQYTVSELARSHDLHAFCYPPFLQLLAYDRTHGTDLAHTVYYHLSQPGAPGAVCARLKIHKNTLYFRLQKARQIMGADFESLSVAALIHFTVLALRYTGQLELEPFELPQQPGREK